jgi:hypothetical protein
MSLSCQCHVFAHAYCYFAEAISVFSSDIPCLPALNTGEAALPSLRTPYQAYGDFMTAFQRVFSH